jgi:hypothetical protein
MNPYPWFAVEIKEIIAHLHCGTETRSYQKILLPYNVKTACFNGIVPFETVFLYGFIQPNLKELCFHERCITGKPGISRQPYSKRCQTLSGRVFDGRARDRCPQMAENDPGEGDYPADAAQEICGGLSKNMVGGRIPPDRNIGAISP